MSAAASKLRVAVIGAGYVASHHLAALAELDFVEIIAICDTNADAAQVLAKRYGGQALKDAGALAALHPDIVHVLTPPASHARLAMLALEMGAHVLVEKPMADSVAECEAMIAKARECGRLLGVNHSDLLDPVVQQAVQAVRNGRIGDVVSVDVIRNSEYPPYAGGPVPASVTQGSYPFRDLGVHGLYTLEAFLGPIAPPQVTCQSSGRDPNLHFDEWQALARGEHGIGRLLLSWNARPMENRLVVRGTQGAIEVDRFLQTCRIQRALPGPKFVGIVIGAMLDAATKLVRVPWNVARFATGSLKPSPGIRSGAAAFVQAVQRGEPAPFSGEDALRIAQLLEPACAEPDRLRHEQLAARLQALKPADALVTGAAGFLGRAVVTALRAKGKRIRVLVRKPVRAFAEDAGVQMVIGDLGDPEIVGHAVAGVATVYHVGAAMRGGQREFEAGTVWGTRNIVDACLQHATPRLVHVSSLSVLDHAGRKASSVVTETSTLEPYPERRGAYTQTKGIAEACVRDAIARHGLPAVILRPGQIFGPGAERSTPNGTLSLAGRWIAVGPTLRTLPLVYVDDAVDAVLLAGTSDAAVGEVFNIVDPRPVTQEQYLAACRRKLGDGLRLLRVPTWTFMLLATAVELLGAVLRRPVPLTRYRVRSLRPLENFDLTAAQTVLGWQPRVGVGRGMAATFGMETSEQSPLADGHAGNVREADA